MVFIGDVTSSSSDSETERSRTRKAKHYRGRPRRIIESSSSSSDNEELEPLNVDNTLQSDQNLLGEDPSVYKASGIPLNDAIVTRWSYYLTKGLESSARETLSEKWKIPDNCSLLKPPQINPEIKGMVSSQGSKKDTYLCSIQEKIGRGLSALGSVLNILVSEDCPSDLKAKITPSLVDAAQCFCESHYLLSRHRKHELLPVLNPLVKRVAEDSIHDNFIFGQDFNDRFKTAQLTEKANKEMGARPKVIFRESNFVDKMSSPRLPSHSSLPGTSTQSLNDRRPYYKPRFRNQTPYMKQQQGKRQPMFRKRY